MSRFVLVAVLSAASLAATTATATACLWDQEVKAHETQFKSSYLEQPAPASPSVLQSLSSPVGLLGVVGVVMLTGATCVGVVRYRASASKPTTGPTI